MWTALSELSLVYRRVIDRMMGRMIAAIDAAGIQSIGAYGPMEAWVGSGSINSSRSFRLWSIKTGPGVSLVNDCLQPIINPQTLKIVHASKIFRFEKQAKIPALPQSLRSRLPVKSKPLDSVNNKWSMMSQMIYPLAAAGEKTKRFNWSMLVSEEESLINWVGRHSRLDGRQ